MRSLFVIAAVAFLYQLAEAGQGSMKISTDVLGYEYTIFADNAVSEGVRVGRSDFGQCHAVPRLILGPELNSMPISIVDSSNPADLKGRIHRNSNGEMVVPNITFDINHANTMFVPQTISVTITFNCSATDSSKDPWAFVGVEITDSTRKIEFEVLKICDANIYSSFDWSVVVLLGLTVLVVFVATLSPVPVSLETKRERNARREEPRADVTVGSVIFFVLAASGILTLAFFYPNAFLVVYTVGLCISGTFLIGVYFFQLIQMGTRKCPQFRAAILQKILYKELTIAEVTGYSLAFLLFVCWMYTKHWMLNNIIAVFFVLCFIRIVRVKSLLVSTLLLSSLFVYDIFWVFFSTPLFGSNVMVTVATKLELPIKILMPHFKPMPTSQCMLIGLGDLVVPGLVIAFSYKVSAKLKAYSYYAANLIAYIISLVICEIMLYVFEQPQPALLYISPLILFAFYLVGIIRKELRMLWKGLGTKDSLELVQPAAIGNEINIEISSVHRSIK